MPNIDRDDEHATRYEMTDTKPTLDEQITKIRILVEAYEYGNVDAGMFLGILASLERLKQIDAAEMPVEPDGLHGSMVDAYQLTKIHQYAVALQAYAQRKEAELSDAVHLNDEQSQRVFRAEAEARGQRERAERYKGIADAFQVDWNKEIDMREKAERERDALIAKYSRLMEAAENLINSPDEDSDANAYFELQSAIAAFKEKS